MDCNYCGSGIGMPHARGCVGEKIQLAENKAMTSPRQSALEAVARAIGEATCAQLRLERVGEGDKQRAYFILPGKALDFDLIARAALDALGSADTDDGWRPIETAPQGWVEVYRPNAKVQPIGTDKLNKQGEWTYSDNKNAPPTHWREQVAPPQRAQEGEG
jgi:hypothetical protein